MDRYTRVFKALSDGTRLRIVHLLHRSGKELCVCELVDSLEESQYNISRHLGVLKNAGLTCERKEGRWSYYGIAARRTAFEEALLNSVAAIPPALLSKDARELEKRLKVRVDGKCSKGILKRRLAPGPNADAKE